MEKIALIYCVVFTIRNACCVSHAYAAAKMVRSSIIVYVRLIFSSLYYCYGCVYMETTRIEERERKIVWHNIETTKMKEIISNCFFLKHTEERKRINNQ